MAARLAPITPEPVELDPRRCFTPMQKTKLFMRAKGKCEVCGAKVKGPWVAGHYPRMAGRRGQKARRKKNGSQIKSRGFDKSLTKGFDGKVRKR